eukprot:1033669-Pyramimonas_sp.AAC.1
MAPRGPLDGSESPPVVVFACGSHTQYNASWPHGELHRRPQWRCSHMIPAPSTALRGPMRSSTEGLSGD